MGVGECHRTKGQEARVVGDVTTIWRVDLLVPFFVLQIVGWGAVRCIQCCQNAVKERTLE
jgi:hypothetical protein